MPVCCLKCDKVFSNQSNLNRHLREKHELENKNIISYDKNVHNFKCDECNCSFINNSELRQHLQDQHNLDNNLMEILNFLSYEDFLMWLKREESEKAIQYFKASTCYNDAFKITYFNCNRSGKIIEKKIKSKITKTTGSCKLNKYCTSQIVVRNDLGTGSIVAQYYYIHYGHSASIQHIRLPKLTKEMVAKKLNNGVTPSRILRDERKHVGAENKQVRRKDLLTRKDINNIKASYKIHINDGIWHKDDATSVDLWINECSRDSELSPIAFYKKQGHYLNEYNFNKDDFCLIIITPAQQHIFESIPDNIICVDSTHGLNAYDFEMTTLLVVDNYGEGFPGACMYSNRKDTYIFEIFFKTIKEKCGHINCKVFMSDIAPAFYNAWRNIMGPAEFQLYCSWHVDRCWQKNLNKVVDKEKRKLLYKHLKFIQYILNEEEFEKELQSLLICLKDVTLNEFNKYFLENYVSIKKQWAFAYRKECYINTNMHLENMHRNLKYLYFDGKKIKRMDKSIHMLLIFIHDKCVERLIKLTKGKTTKHMTKIHACHRSAAIATNYKIFQNSLNETIIKDTKNGKEYQIFKNQIKESCCHIKCNFCRICIHNYKCTCIDFLIRSVICKHIHFFILNETESIHKNVPGSTHIDSNEDNRAVDSTSQQLIQSLKQSDATIKFKVQQIKNDASAIINNIGNNNVSSEEIRTIAQHVKVAKEMLYIGKNLHSSSSKFVPLKSTIKEPENKRVEKQIAFFSTKKKIKKHTGYLKKPNEEEEVVLGSLLHDHNY